MPKKVKNGSGRWNFQSCAWPTCDVVFGWNSNGRAVGDWTTSVESACHGPGWQRQSSSKGLGWCIGGMRKKKKKGERERESHVEGGERELKDEGPSDWPREKK